ncbi:LysR family transcriptional regulator [Chitinibacteraceae bacterium HSL-7]
MNSPLPWDDLKLFLAVAETGSLSAAARQTGLAQATLSRRIAEFEQRCGQTLFERVPGGCVLTDAGEALLPSVARMAEWASDAEQILAPGQNPLSGSVRVAAPPLIAQEIMAPLAARIRQRHPALRLDLRSGVAVLNLARGEADISVRTQRPSDGDLICLGSVSSTMRAYATPGYLATLPEPCTLDMLDWIAWAPPYDKLYTNRALAELIDGFEPVIRSDDINVQLAACRAGAGVMVLPELLFRYSLKPELVPLDLTLGEGAYGALYVVVHKRQRHLARICAVADAILAELHSV